MIWINRSWVEDVFTFQTIKFIVAVFYAATCVFIDGNAITDTDGVTFTVGAVSAANTTISVPYGGAAAGITHKQGAGGAGTLIVFGDKEKESGKLSVRRRNGTQEELTMEELATKLKEMQNGMPEAPLPLPKLLSKRISFRG